MVIPQNKKQLSENRQLKNSNVNAKIHLSSLNKRITIKNYNGSQIEKLLEQLRQLAQKNNLSKIWVKSHEKDYKKFKKSGFQQEGVIKKYFPENDAIIMSYFTDKKRKQRKNHTKAQKILKEISSQKIKQNHQLPDSYRFKLAQPKDLPQLARFYEKIFVSYPQPIFNPDYLKQKQTENLIYGIITRQEEIVGAASAETKPELRNAEMTDFATLPGHRGQGLAYHLLNKLEERLQQKKYRALYTIARANIFGINKIFYQNEYQYTGTLIQNCEIDGQLEDMNIWTKII